MDFDGIVDKQELQNLLTEKLVRMARKRFAAAAQALIDTKTQLMDGYNDEEAVVGLLDSWQDGARARVITSEDDAAHYVAERLRSKMEVRGSQRGIQAVDHCLQHIVSAAAAAAAARERSGPIDVD
jgi:hypothetical protein